jgi:glutamate-ammonia-ligase adenylyltransferase
VSPVDGRPVSASGRLARSGFQDSERAAGSLAALGLWDEGSSGPAEPWAAALLDLLALAADPDLALHQLHRLAEAIGTGWPGLRDALRGDHALRSRLVAVLGASAALGDHLIAQPAQWRLLAEALATPLLRPPPDGNPVAGLRLAYRGALLRIAAADLTGEADVERTMAVLSTLADETLREAYRQAEVATGGTARLAVVAMGKCGGRELNYVSDVDVVYVAESDDDLAPATAIAIKLMEICAQVAWPVDAALRPEGSRGPLVRTLASHLAYYKKWARTWEFQALLKALDRPAGAAGLARRRASRGRRRRARHAPADHRGGTP